MDRIKQFGVTLNSLEEIVNSNYNSLDSYLFETNKLAIDEQDKLNMRIIEFENQNNDPEITGTDHSFEEFQDLLNFKQDVLVASFILSHSKFESILRRICLDYCLEENFKITINDIAGNGHISKFKKYLELVFDVDFGNLKEEWDVILFCNEMRNKFIHQLGILDEKQVNSFKSKELDREIITISNENKIIIQAKFISNFLANCKKILEHILKGLREQEKKKHEN